MTLGARLPVELLRQPKRGFGVPPHWFRGSLHSGCRDNYHHLWKLRELWFREWEQPRLAPAPKGVDG